MNTSWILVRRRDNVTLSISSVSGETPSFPSAEKAWRFAEGSNGYNREYAGYVPVHIDEYRKAVAK